MTQVRIWLFVCLMCLWGGSALVPARAQNSVLIQTLEDGERLHTIQPGETLYGLTRLYGVTAEAICAANPGLSAQNFKAGTVILIPKPTEEPAKTEEQPAQEAASEKPVGIAGSNCREMHRVKSKETLFSIAQKYGVTLEELRAANPETLQPGYELKKKDVLCIPYHREPTKAVKVEEKAPSNEELFRQVRGEERGLSTIRVGVVLPLKEQTPLAARTLDFYRGLLMAVDSMKHTGLNFEIYTFDAGTTAEDINRVLQRPIFPQLDIVFGPVDPTQIKAVSKVSEQWKIPMVVPFYSKSEEVFTNPYLFVLNAPDTIQYVEAERLFKASFQGRNIVMVDTGEKTDGFVSYLKKDFPSLRYTKLPVDENTLISRLDENKENVIVLSSADLKSLNIFMPVMRNVVQSRPELKLKLFGYPEWLTYSGSLVEDYCVADTYIYSSFFTDYASPAFTDFSNRFLKNFNTEMLRGTPRMGVYGYDCGLFFFKGLSRHGKNFSVQANEVQHLQHKFRMQRVSTWGGMFNRTMQLVRYMPNHQIEIHQL